MRNPAGFVFLEDLKNRIHFFEKSIRSEGLLSSRYPESYGGHDRVLVEVDTFQIE
jgi:hypothetical protein